MRAKNQEVCTGTVSTESEGIKQCEIITILGNRVGAGRVPMSVIDVTQLEFGLGLFRVVHRQGETMLEDAGSTMMIGIALDFVGVCWEVDWGVMDMVLSLTAPESGQD